MTVFLWSASSGEQTVIVHLKVKSLSSSSSTRRSKPAWFSFFCQTRDLWQDAHADLFLIMKVNSVLSSSKMTVKGLVLYIPVFRSHMIICCLFKIFPSFIALKSHDMNMQIFRFAALQSFMRHMRTIGIIDQIIDQIVWFALTYLLYFNYNLL